MKKVICTILAVATLLAGCTAVAPQKETDVAVPTLPTLATEAVESVIGTNISETNIPETNPDEETEKKLEKQQNLMSVEEFKELTGMEEADEIIEKYIEEYGITGEEIDEQKLEEVLNKIENSGVEIILEEDVFEPTESGD